MPSFSCSSSVRVASQHHALRLKITHNFVRGSPSAIKLRLPKELDVLWLSDLTLSLSGSLDGDEIPAHDIARSGLVRHFRTQLKANGDRLGLNNVSDPFVDDADDVLKLTLTPSRPLPRASRPHANLVSFHLAYIWTTVAAGCGDVVHMVEKLDPFSPTLFLPAEVLLARATEQFLIYHLVGRYPLIFGSWCKRLDLEMQYFPSIGHSIVEMMNRSRNRGFSSKCKHLIKIARIHHKSALLTCTAALASCVDDAASPLETEVDNPLPMPVLTDEQILCESLEQLFRAGVRRRRFKPVPCLQFVSSPQDDDDMLSSVPSVGIDDEASWVELPEIATTPRVPVPDSHQTLPDEMGMLAKEDWPEDEMWRIQGAETSPGERKLDARSDESLISASTLLASVTTPSLQARFVAPYHYLGVDSGQPDLAASGMCYDAFPSTYPQDPGPSALLADPTHSPSHGHHYSGKYERLMQGLGRCQVGLGSFEALDSSSEHDGAEDSDTILLDLDGDSDVLGRSADAADLVAFDVGLDWDWDDSVP